MSETIYEQYVAAMVHLGLQPLCIAEMWNEVRGAFFVGDSQSIYDCPNIDYVRLLLELQQEEESVTKYLRELSDGNL